MGILSLRGVYIMALRIYKDSLKSDKKQVANNLRRKSHGMNKVKSGLKNPVALMDTDFISQHDLRVLCARCY